MVCAEAMNLEIAYDKACRDVELVYKEEEYRRTRLDRLLLVDENEELRLQLEHDGDRIDELEILTQDLQAQLDAAILSSEDNAGEIRIRLREIDTLKTELDSLNGVTSDSAKLLTEKLSLSRELNALRPEVEHLRSLASSHQTLLSEKLSLQRHITTLEMEVENERRSTKRALERDGRAQANDAKIEASLEAAQADLAKEKRERQKADRENQKSSAEMQNRITTLESRLDNFRTKLKSTKETLTETQNELQKARAAKDKSSATTTRSTPVAANGRKRAISDMHADAKLGTPGDMPAAKRNRINQSLPGDKSTFSITPFLNRTLSVAPEDPTDKETSDVDKENVENLQATPIRGANSKVNGLSASKKAVSKANIQNQAPSPSNLQASNEQVRKPSTKSGQARKAMAQAPRLAKVTEEEDPGSSKPANVTETESQHKVALAKDQTTTEATKVEKKKRKILGGGLGKTLFDEDDSDGPARARKTITASKGFNAMGRGNAGAPVLSHKAMSGFGAISPLKKERRAVIA